MQVKNTRKEQSFMKNNTLFEQFRSRLVRIGIVKALIPALVIGFAVNFLLAFITWFLDLSLVVVLIVSIGAGVLAAAISAPIFYCKLFRPTTKMIARTVDRLGLEERIITMHELENDESYIAMRQREDAKESLSRVDRNQLKYNLSKALVISLCIVCVLGLSMTVVSSLAALDVISTGSGLIGSLFPPEEEIDPDTGKPIERFTVIYVAGVNGSIQGQAIQTVKKGYDASPVLAVPDEGYEFLAWSDGLMTAERWDWEILEDFTVEAVFIEERMKQPGDGEGDGDGDSKGDAGNKSDKPNSDDPDKSTDGAGRGGDTDNNTVINGETKYKDRFDYKKSMDDVLEDESLSDELRDILANFFDSLNS